MIHTTESIQEFRMGHGGCEDTVMGDVRIRVLLPVCRFCFCYLYAMIVSPYTLGIVSKKGLDITASDLGNQTGGSLIRKGGGIIFEARERGQRERPGVGRGREWKSSSTRSLSNL